MSRSRGLALTALFAALSLIVLGGASVMPAGRLGLTALSGILPAAAAVSGGGLRAGLLCYSCTGLLGLILVPDKGCVLLYLLFFGIYPLVKSLVERCGIWWKESFLKLVFFNGVLTLFWLVLKSMFLPFLPAVLNGTLPVYLAGNVVFLAYDHGLSGVIWLYIRRIHHTLRK